MSKSNSFQKKASQLGMNPSTASGRLIKDLLWNFVETTGNNKCHICGKVMTRDTFSVEHIVPWLDSDNPVDTFFDVDNVAYSHLKCNIGSARKASEMPNASVRSGINTSRGRFNAEDIIHIRRNYKSRCSINGNKAYCEKYGVTRDTITDIVKGRSYSEI